VGKIKVDHVHFFDLNLGRKNEHHPLMNAILITEPLKIDKRLESLGLSKEHFKPVSDAMRTARNSTTDNDPMGAGGILSWITGTRRIREILIPLGWERDTSGGIPSIFSPKHKIRIAVLNADSGVCSHDEIPQPRSRKGAATDDATSVNQQVFSEIMECTAPSPRDSDVTQWYFCHYCDGKAVRAELSLPTGFSNGHFTEFGERIFILTETDDGLRETVRKHGPDDGSNFAIPVTRKQAM
jgi:hypothetical protein